MQELLSHQDIKTVRPLSVRMIFDDNHNWDAFSLANKSILRDVEIKEVKKMISCKDEKRGYFIQEWKIDFFDNINKGVCFQL
ncbi:MAG: hypothetical protein HF976_13945 [ANME-2 cluster archaeon]|nr:hypothetical protein [ANME-2 cluster archaeon]